MTFAAPPDQRLFERPEPPTLAARGLFAAILLICLLFHAAAIWLFLNYERSPQLAQAEQEIPVEVIVEPPPPEEKEKPPEPPPPEKQKPLDEKIATDAPRPANEEQVKREDARDDVSHSPKTESQEATVNPGGAPQPADAATAKAEEPPAAEPMDQDPNGEPIAPKPTPKPETKEQKAASQPAAKPDAPQKPAPDPKSAFAALPDYSFAPVSRKAPIATGKAASTYLSVVYGMVMSRMHYPEGAAGHGKNTGEIVFAVDGVGRLVGQRIIKSTGSPELDLAALAAIRAASPFPPPPTGGGINLNLHFRR